MNRSLQLLCLLLAVLGLTARAADPGYDLGALARVPVVFNGRHQPLDSLGRNSLIQIRHRYSLYDAKEKRTLPATEWIAEVMMRPEAADARKAFRVDHPDLISLLRLPGKNEALGEDGKHYSWNQIEPGFKEIEDQAKRILETKKDASQRDAFDQELLKLRNALTLYLRLKNTVHPQDTTDFSAELKAFEAAIPPGVAALRDQQAGRAYSTNDFENLLRYASRYDAANRMEPPLIIPPEGAAPGAEWRRSGDALLGHIRNEPLPGAVAHWAALSSAFRSGDAAGFNSAIARYGSFLESQKGLSPDRAKASREVFFNRLSPFYNTMPVYVAAFLLVCVYWFRFTEGARKLAGWLVLGAFVVHTVGLVFRMWLEGRPPVTNLYSSAIFIGWGSVALGLILERFWRNGIGLAVASSLGFVTLIIAHNLALGGDTLQMLQAVLDTNFWLATHVVIVTLGYASTYVAGFLAIIYLVRGLFTSGLDAATGKSLARMVYGIVCFATLFSFVGTVLGGIWADQSWGRFWGWDPKENGALIIVLWNALILHARWGGMVRERGLMNLAVIGNIVTSWSWFGTNMLGIGLHSYGFMSGAFLWLGGFILSQLALAALGCLPPRMWRSGRAG
ncbi:MAG: cytochrome c biogenesis protein [Limisphaerales bacterium]